jgi:hypothetical protein
MVRFVIHILPLLTLSPSRPRAPCICHRRPRLLPRRPGLPARLPSRQPNAVSAGGDETHPPRPPPMLSSRMPSPASSAPRPLFRGSPARPRSRSSSPPDSGPAPSSRPSTPPSRPAAGSPPSRFPPLASSPFLPSMSGTSISTMLIAYCLL